MSALEPFNDEVPTTTTTVQALAVGLGTHSAVALGGFADFCLKSELSNAIRENGFEHPSEVQHQALPQAMLGSDILAQAKAGMGKTAVFVFALLEQMEKVPEGKKPHCQAIVIAHSRELALQLENEFKRFNKYLPHCTTGCFYGGVSEVENVRQLKKEVPAIVVGTPGRLNALIKNGALDAKQVKWFVIDEFDRCLEDVRMRADIQNVFINSPKSKQVMMFSATMTDELRNVARKFMNNPTEIYVDQQAKLTLHGLKQFYCNCTEADKSRRLVDVLDTVDFNQCIVFVSTVERCEALTGLLNKLKFPAKAMHSRMEQSERFKVYESCKSNQTRIVVATDLMGRGVDIDRINLVVQYDMTSEPDQYLHRVGRAGRFGTKGVTVAFLTDDEREIGKEKRKYTDKGVMKEVEDRFEANCTELTDIKEQLSQAQLLQ